MRTKLIWFFYTDLIFFNTDSVQTLIFYTDCLKEIWGEWQKSETSWENSKRFHAKCRKSSKKCKAKKCLTKKKHSRTSPDVQFKEFSLTKQKLDLEQTINGLGKTFRKESDPKIEKRVKNKVKLPHVNKKSLARKLIFVQTPFLTLH